MNTPNQQSPETAQTRPTRRASAGKADPQPVERVSVVSEDMLAEAIFNPALKPSIQFAVSRGDKVALETSLTVNGRQVIPPSDPNRLIERRVILLPPGAALYGSQAELLAEVKRFIYRNRSDAPKEPHLFNPMAPPAG